MLVAAQADGWAKGVSPAQLRSAMQMFVSSTPSAQAKVDGLINALRGPHGDTIRRTAATWICEHAVPARHLVPGAHERWVPVVRAAMEYVVLHLSAERLAPKLIEQLELPVRTRPETRLLRLISRVPALQKLGQVLARNRHLRPSLRRALTVLENGIRDVGPADVALLIRERLGERIDRYDVRFRPVLLSEASVSAVVRFTWKNPETGQRERGVFKVLKPYIPEFFAEDMDLLHGLAEFFSSKLEEYGLSGDVLSDTFSKVRLLLQHEVDFEGEQNTLRTACAQYRAIRGVRVPQIIVPLCMHAITAMTEERGLKINVALAHSPKRKRAQVARLMLEALAIVPLFSSDDNVVFHADPHAGNLLYDSVTGNLTILDWALTERLSREQRRHLGLLFIFVALRDAVAASLEIEALREKDRRNGTCDDEMVRRCVQEFIDQLPFARVPKVTEPMRLLESLAMKGVRFPGSLVMLSKVMLMIDGILYGLGASRAEFGLPLARYLAHKVVFDRKSISTSLTARDYIAIQLSSLLLVARLGVRTQELLVQELLPRAQTS